uniref:Reverse transcriptase domain-containing protein n=1 Tax=Tanacetum cinerariifolium TaxID=118510 RepID=A0A6L2JKR5_TANCI|nr:reverse transcriptase domain-containing protein [Tanacetum cinerariifolium]
MPNTRSGATMTCEAVKEQINYRLAGALGARDAAKNLKPLMGNKGNGNGGNRNSNGNGGGNGYNFGGFMPARECTYQDFLKCQSHSFNGTKGVVGLTRWFEKMKTVFHVSNCPKKYQLKYATCTLLNSALTLWNSHKRTIRIEAAYAISWEELIKRMTEVYCLRNEELVLLCTRMVPNEEDKVERFVGDTSYVIELTDGRMSETNVVLRGCTLGLLGHSFEIYLMSVELGSFDIIISMDWLTNYHTLIVCDEKIIHIPYGDKVLIIRGDDCDVRSRSKLNIILCMKTYKYIKKGCQAYLAQVTSKKTEDKLEEKRLEDVPIVQEFLEVFPEDLPDLLEKLNFKST